MPQRSHLSTSWRCPFRITVSAFWLSWCGSRKRGFTFRSPNGGERVDIRIYRDELIHNIGPCTRFCWEVKVIAFCIDQPAILHIQLLDHMLYELQRIVSSLSNEAQRNGELFLQLVCAGCWSYAYPWLTPPWASFIIKRHDLIVSECEERFQLGKETFGWGFYWIS